MGSTTINLDVDVLLVFGPPACFLFLFSVRVVCGGVLYASKNVHQQAQNTYVSKNVQQVHNRAKTQSVLLCKGGLVYAMGSFGSYGFLVL